MPTRSARIAKADAGSSTCTSPQLILGDIDPEFEQFAMNAGRSPQRICAANFSDQIPHVFGYARVSPDGDGTSTTTKRL